MSEINGLNKCITRLKYSTDTKGHNTLSSGKKVIVGITYVQGLAKIMETLQVLYTFLY
jgi:hypothetical protein